MEAKDPRAMNDCAQKAYNVQESSAGVWPSVLEKRGARGFGW